MRKRPTAAGAGHFRPGDPRHGSFASKEADIRHLVLLYQRNYDSITSEEYYDMPIEKGAYFIWFFHYMPVGSGAAPELLLSPEQAKRCTAASAISVPASRCLRWISRTTLSSWAAASRAPAVPAYQRQRRYRPCVFIHYWTAASAKRRCWKPCSRRQVMAYRDGQPSTTICSGPAPCLKTRKSSGDY